MRFKYLWSAATLSTVQFLDYLWWIWPFTTCHCSSVSHYFSAGYQYILIITSKLYYHMHESLDLHIPLHWTLPRSSPVKVSAIVPETIYSSPISFPTVHWVLTLNVVCFVGPLSVPVVQICVLWEAGAKAGLYIWDLFGESVYKGKGDGVRGGDGEPIRPSSRSDPYEGERKCCIERVSDYSMFLRKFG